MRSVLFYISISVLFLGCTKEFEVNLENGENSLCVQSVFNQEHPITLRATTFVPTGSADEIDTIHNAMINLYEDDIFLETLKYLGNGYYQSVSVPTYSKYKIDIVTPDFPFVWAETSMPQSVPVLACDTASKIEHIFILHLGQTKDYEVLSLTIHFDDPENERNFYMLEPQIKSVDSLGDHYYGQGFGSNDPVFGMSTLEISDLINFDHWPFIPPYFKDELFNGMSASVNIFIMNPYTREGNAGLRIYLHNISEVHFRNIESIRLQYEAYDNTFTEPPVTPSNINGGVGLFTGMNSSYIDIEF